MSTAPPRRLVRRTDQKVIGGVCSGLADYAGIDPTIVRVVVAVGSFFTLPLGPLLYVLLWILVPVG
jgi:phage shock protein PspC (stress-responsive transcriptional regulator)